MGGGEAPTPPSPTQSAQAQAQSQLAGQQFQAMNEPVLAAQDATNRGMFSPYETQLQSALQAPPSSSLPSMDEISALARMFGSNLGSVRINQGGTNTLVPAQGYGGNF